jgi:hypothetical protein
VRLVKLLTTLAVTVLVVSAAALVFVLIMRGRVEETTVASLPPPALSTRGDVEPPAVVVLRSTATARYFASLPGSDAGAYQRRIEDWRRRLGADGIAARVLDETALVATALPRDVVLLAPSTAALDDATLAHVNGMVEQGAGLIATWAFGMFDGDGTWRGYEPLRRLAGLELLPAAEQAEAPRFVALHGQTSITAGLPAGARLEVQPYDRPLPLTSSAAVGEYVEWSMLGRGPDLTTPPQTAVARATMGAGRVVWMNFEPAAVVGGGTSPERLTQLVRNAVAWTSRAPLGALETWPNGARIAASLGLDAEHRFDEGKDVAERLHAARVPFTSFVLTSLADGHPDALRALTAASELGSHTHDHRPLSEQDEAAQRRQLEESRRIVADLTGKTVLGLRPPEEQTNEHTLQALAASGYHYVVGWREKDAAEPWMLQANGKAVVVLPRIPHDDFEYVVRRPGDDVAAAWASMRADLKQVQRLGGFYFFDFHTQFWDAPAIHTGVRHLTGLRNLPGVWLATVGEVAAWWRTRARAAARVDGDADGAITVELASGSAVHELGVVVYVPSDPGGWTVESIRGAAPALSVVGGRDDALRLAYRELGANDRRVTRLVRRGDGARVCAAGGGAAGC